MKKLAILLFLIVFSLIGCDSAGGLAGGGGASTPEAVLHKAEAARKAGNWKTYVNCHTNETISAMVEQGLQTALTLQAGKKMAALGGPAAVAQVEQKMKPLTDIYTKYGVTSADLDKLAEMPDGPEKQQAVKAAVAKISDRNGFAADMMAVQWKEMTTGAHVEDAKSEIKNVTIEGDTATATVSAILPSGGPPFEVPMKLKKTSQGWKIDNTQFLQ
jgi:hypothetical protein